MTDFYCDHGAYASVLGTTPTWGVPQEGDGSSKAAATASSVASIAFASVPTTGALSVCGISIGTAGVIGAASVGAAADALAGLINGVMTPVAPGVAVGTPQLRNLVYARGPTLGAPAGTCQIMMRVGSSALNQATNALAAIASTFDGTPTLVQFAGGSGGCWGWFINSAAIGVSSSITLASYGLLKAYPMAWTSAPGQSDFVWVRSGADPTIQFTSSATIDLGRSTGAANTNLFAAHFVIDTNTQWTSDSASGTFTLDFNMSSTANVVLPFVSGASNSNAQPYVGSISALRKDGFVIRAATTGSGGIIIPSGSVSVGQGFRLSQCLIEDDSAGANVMRISSSTLGTGAGVQPLGAYLFDSCRIKRLNPIAQLLPVALLPGTAAAQMLVSVFFSGGSIEANVSGATADPVCILSSTAGGGAAVNAIDFSFKRVKFSGWAAGGDRFALHNTAASTLTWTRIVAQDCEGLSLTSAYAGLSVSGYFSDQSRSHVMIHSSAIGGPWRFENHCAVVEWNPDATPSQPIFATSHSVHLRWLGAAFIIDRNKGFELPVMRLRYQGAASTRLIRLELLLHSALQAALKLGDITSQVSYVSDTTGSLMVESINSLSASSAAWIDASGYPSHVPQAMELTTAHPIRQFSEVALHITLRGNPRTGVSESVFFDPEFSAT